MVMSGYLQEVLQEAQQTKFPYVRNRALFFSKTYSLEKAKKKIFQRKTELTVK